MVQIRQITIRLISDHFGQQGLACFLLYIVMMIVNYTFVSNSGSAGNIIYLNLYILFNFI